MAKLENVSVGELEAALEEVAEKRPAQRLMVAIMYKRGPSVPMLAEWLDMRERTIYDWFDRLEEQPITDAVTDDHRSGRPPKLAEQDREAFVTAVNNPPQESGYDQPAWSTELAQRFLREEFEVEYSQRHITRLLHEAGLSHRTQRSQPPTTGEDEHRVYWESSKEAE